MVRQYLRIFVIALSLVALTVGIALAENDYDRPVSQSEFALGVHAAIIGQSRSTLKATESLQILKDRGVIPGNWQGSKNVTMGQAQEIFSQLGIQIYVKDPELLLSLGQFEQILREQRGKFQLTRQHWRIIHGFSTDLTLGQYRERIISGSGF